MITDNLFWSITISIKKIKKKVPIVFLNVVRMVFSVNIVENQCWAHLHKLCRK